jgi:hypothetical protein
MLGVTFGKNLDTNMSSLKFDSTGRTVEFTPEESADFDTFLKGIKTMGKIEQEDKQEPDNPFRLFMDDYRRDTAMAVNIAVRLLIDELVQNISDLEVTSEYDNLLPDVASDTSSREAMAEYFEGLLEPIFDAVDYTQMRQDFFMHL